MILSLASGRVCLGISMRDTSTLVKTIGFNPAPADQPLLIFGIGDLHVASAKALVVMISINATDFVLLDKSPHGMETHIYRAVRPRSRTCCVMD